jgi:hypothetical protein
MSMVSSVVGGVDTHTDVHVATAVDSNGGVLGIESFPADAGGHEALAGWLVGFGPVPPVGVEGTGSYGVGLQWDSADFDNGTFDVCTTLIPVANVTTFTKMTKNDSSRRRIALDPPTIDMPCRRRVRQAEA